MHWLVKLASSPVTLRRAALASLIGNVALVITGGAVRLTGSGLGCPTWPRCTDTSYVTTAAMGVHGLIEYGNRMLTGALVAIAVVGAVVALFQRPRRRRVTWLSLAVLATIPLQAVIGGITVRTHLNPWVVACHFLVTVGIIALAYAFWMATRESDAAPVPTVARPLRHLMTALTVVSVAVIVAGTVVTGSGPHAGDETAPRTGLDPGAVAQVHADLVFLFIGVSVGAFFALRAAGAKDATVRAGWLLGIIAAQAVIGFVQYATHLPAIIVGVHMAGACAVWIATLNLLYGLRTRTDHVENELRLIVGTDWAPMLEDARGADRPQLST